MLTFGPRAARWAAALPSDLPLIATDEFGVADAYRSAVGHRERAEPFFVWLCIPSPRAAFARAIAAHVNGGRSYDDQRHAFTDLATGALLVDGNRVDQAIDGRLHGARAAFADLLLLADGLFATSRGEAERLVQTFGVLKASVAVAALPSRDVPQVRHSGADRSIVVWANGIPFEENLVLVHALEEMRLPLVTVANDGEIFARAGERPPASLEEALAGASVIVDASPDNPAVALALARIGTPLVTAATSGAHEYVDGARTYKPWDWKSIYDATAQALGAPAPRLRDTAATLAEARATIAGALRPPAVDGPRVTVVVPTYDRRDRLPGALDALFRQQHRDLEVIVVNDGGMPVDDIVARFPHARLISYTPNRGPEHALNVGFAAATGTYVTLLPDDDLFYPDHLARLVEACERSGCAIAHGNTLVRFERTGGGEPAGFAANVFYQPLEKTEALYNSPLAGHSFLVRRDVGERLGWFDESLPVLGDQELQTRFAAHYDFAHVNRFTAEWRFTGGTTNLSSRKASMIPAAMQQWFDRHPSDRPRVALNRAALLERVATEASGGRFQPVIRFPAADE